MKFTLYVLLLISIHLNIFLIKNDSWVAIGHNKVLVEWEWEDLSSLQKYNKEIEKNEIDMHIDGSAEYNELGTWCKITAKMPVSRYDRKTMDTLGHELLHCFIGSYHN